MNIINILIVLVVLALVFGVLYIVYGDRLFGKKGGKDASDSDSVSVPVASIVRVRAAGTRKMVVELDLDYIPGAETLPIYSDLEPVDMEEDDDLERFRDPSTPLTEKMRIYEKLTSAGYEVRKPDVLAEEPGEKPAPVREVPKDFSSVNDLGELQRYLQTPGLDAASRQAATARMNEIMTGISASGREAGSPSGNGSAASSESEDSSSDDDSDGPVEGFVDPDTHESVDVSGDGDVGEEGTDAVNMDFFRSGGAESGEAGKVSGSEKETDSGDVKEEGRVHSEEAGGEEDILERIRRDEPLVPESDGEVFEFDISELDDSEDSAKCIELMTFIARSFRKGLIRPDLVKFSEQKLHLRVTEGLWSEDSRKTASYIMEQHPEEYNFLEKMDINKFDMTIRTFVDSEKSRKDAFAKRAAEAVAAAAAPSGEPEPVSVFPLRRGGVSDMMWQRLEAYGSDLL